MASRGGDGTVKCQSSSSLPFPLVDSFLTVWDTKSFKKPLFTATDLPSLNPETNLIFSPDEKYILTGTSGAMAGILAGANKEIPIGEGGKVVVLKVDGLEVVRKLGEFQKLEMIGLVADEPMNQIFQAILLYEFCGIQKLIKSVFTYLEFRFQSPVC